MDQQLSINMRRICDHCGFCHEWNALKPTPKDEEVLTRFYTVGRMFLNDAGEAVPITLQGHNKECAIEILRMDKLRPPAGFMDKKPTLLRSVPSQPKPEEVVE